MPDKKQYALSPEGQSRLITAKSQEETTTIVVEDLSAQIAADVAADYDGRIAALQASVESTIAARVEAALRDHKCNHVVLVGCETLRRIPSDEGAPLLDGQLLLVAADDFPVLDSVLDPKPVEEPRFTLDDQRIVFIPIARALLGTTKEQAVPVQEIMTARAQGILLSMHKADLDNWLFWLKGQIVKKRDALSDYNRRARDPNYRSR